MTIMSKFHELNNYISDVPMRFSDKYLSLQVNSTLTENNDGENIDRFKVEDYKFKAELVAIEMFELYQKKKLEQSSKQNKTSENFSSNKENSNVTKDNTSNYVTTFLPNSSSRTNQSNFFYNMIPGEILKPQPLSKNTPTIRSSVHNECDKSHSDNKSRPNLKENLVNPKEFENDDSSPFDNVELQTIDDLKELNNVFQALNTGTEKECQELKKDNELTNNNSQNRTCISSKTLNQSTNVYHPNGIHYSPSVQSDSSLQICATRSAGLYNNSNAINQASTAPYSQATGQHSSPHNTNDQQPQINKIAMSASYNNTVNSMPIYDHTMSYNSHIVYPQQCNSQFEMKRSSSEKKDIFNANYVAAIVDHSSNSLRSTKSVSDLTNISKAANNSFNSESNTLHDRSRTPPHNAAMSNNEVYQIKSKPLSLSDPYQSLSELEKQFIDNLCQMGFKRDRVSRAVKHIDIKDDKKIFEYLLALQQLEDQGYNCYESEIALHMNNYSKDHAEIFLQTLKQICDFGFDKEAAIKALFKSNNDRDKAIDLLLNSR